jgi:mxaK protein
MNKYLNLSHWLLVIIVIVSLLFVGQASYSLWQTGKINAFISEPTKSENVPEHLKAQFAQAYNDVEEGRSAKALERLTTVLETKDASLEAMAYYNRANIHLRDAKALPSVDAARLPLVGLAKQDYRTALLLDSSLWDARYNLELALLMVPEEATINKAYGKRIGSESVAVKAVGFRVDLP